MSALALMPSVSVFSNQGCNRCFRSDSGYTQPTLWKLQRHMTKTDLR